MSAENKEKQSLYEEVTLTAKNGMGMLLLNLLLIIGSIVLLVIFIDSSIKGVNMALSTAVIILATLYLLVISPILFAGLKVLKPNEAYVFTLFGKYHGTLRGAGFYFVNPFVTAVNPTVTPAQASLNVNLTEQTGKTTPSATSVTLGLNKKISLKTMTLNNDKQKINDLLGNPIIIGIVVIWKVVNTAYAVFNVDNYKEYLSIQADSALRNIVRLYPYDSVDADNEGTLRGSSQDVADKIKAEIQAKVAMAGIDVIEARITHLSYAPEIAAAMLQRQQASAVVDARQMIVEGAVGMVEMALNKLNENDIVHLDEERKAAMVSNLLVVLCGNKDAQPIVNSGSLY